MMNSEGLTVQLSKAQLELLVKLDLVEITRTTADGSWVEYQLTGKGRIMVRDKHSGNDGKKSLR